MNAAEIESQGNERDVVVIPRKTVTLQGGDRHQLRGGTVLLPHPGS